jgi:MoaA/NifB/PqqE/SkfB family radical SAM enzyme
MCHVWQSKDPGHLKVADYERILQDDLFSNVRHAVLSGGEPTLRPDLAEIGGVLGRCLPGLRLVLLTTNGLGPGIILPRVQGLLAALPPRVGLRVQVSMDGLGEEHDHIRGVPHAHQRVEETLERLQALAAQEPRLTKVYLSCVIQPANLHVIEAVREFAQARNMDVIFPVVTFAEYYGNVNDDGLRFSQEQQEEVLAFLERVAGSERPSRKLLYRDVIHIARGGTMQRGCLLLDDTFTLAHDARVVPCVNTDFTEFGRADQEPVADLWWRQASQEKRAQIKREVCPTCMVTCSVNPFNILLNETLRRVKGDALQ